MLYKTIVFELLPQYPALYERLRTSRAMPTALDQYALALKASHQAWITGLSRTRPGSTASQLASEALELAVEELQADLQRRSSPSDEDQTVALDPATGSLRRHTPPE